MENQEVVNTPLTQEQVEETKQAESEVLEETKETATDSDSSEEVEETKAGDKTDPNLLLKAVQEERQWRKDEAAKRIELEEKIKQLETSTSSESEVFSDEGKALQSNIKKLEDDLVKLKSENELKDLLITNPDIKEHLTEFEEYRNDPENKGMGLNTAAKGFLIDKGLLDTRRKGLEKATGGDKQVSKVGKMTHSDAEQLRRTNYNKYRDMLQKGLVQIVD